MGSIDELSRARSTSCRYCFWAERFEVPEDFDPSFLFKKGAVGLWPTDIDPEVLRLAFAPDVATGVRERQWPDAQWDEREEGWHVLQMRVAVTPEIIAWVFVLGREHRGAGARDGQVSDHGVRPSRRCSPLIHFHRRIGHRRCSARRTRW